VIVFKDFIASCNENDSNVVEPEAKYCWWSFLETDFLLLDPTQLELELVCVWSESVVEAVACMCGPIVLLNQ
jgi:hypothetical protein